tara:strand:- start:807 stop:1049 length:243 start_codon:yes stop_codon:yes gene_type:complete
MEEIIEYCGYKNAFDLIKDHSTEEDLTTLLEDLVNSPEEAVDFIEEIVERIASDYFEWVDHEKIKADADEEAYQRYRDGD